MKIRRSVDLFRQFIVSVVRKIIEDQVFFRATSLAFTSAITLVPVTMVIFSFGGFDQLGLRIMDALGEFLVPGGKEIMEAFHTFTFNARRLGTWGSLLFVVSSAMLLNTMENHLNTIFRVRHHRGIVRRVGLYIASLALISFVFGSGFGPISGMIDAWHKFPAANQRILGIVLSILGAMIGMIFLFSMLSAARIRFRSALVGSFIGALGFQTAKFGFTIWTTRSVRQSVIYGSVVFIPKLLLWLDVAWIIFLISAEITYALQTGAGRRTPYKPGSPAEETELGWNIYLTLADDFRQGLRPPGIRDLAIRNAVDESRVSDIIRTLEDGGLVHPVAGHPVGYLPSRSPADLEATRVIAVITGWDHTRDANGKEGTPELIKSGIRSVFGTRSVRSFLTGKYSPDEDPPAAS